MTADLTNAIDFLSNQIIGETKYQYNINKDLTGDLEKTCIEIANKLKEYGRPLEDQVTGLFALCYREEIVMPNGMDLALVENFISEKISDNIACFNCFRLNPRDSRLVVQSRVLKEEEKNILYWLYMAVNQVIFREEVIHEYLKFLLGFPDAKKHLRETSQFKNQVKVSTEVEELAHSVGITEDIAKFEAFMKKQ
jgi:hypothetical protein